MNTDQALVIADGYNSNVKVGVSSPEHEAISCLAAEVRRLREDTDAISARLMGEGYEINAGERITTALHEMICDMQELREENERIHAATPQQSPGPDCRTCANRGMVNGLSQETYCDGCVWYGAYWKKNHYKPLPEPAP